MLWIIKLLLEGKQIGSISNGNELKPSQYRAHVHSIANFLRIEDYRIEMIEFDPQ